MTVLGDEADAGRYMYELNLRPKRDVNNKMVVPVKKIIPSTRKVVN
jgi:hypothetical protein